MVKKSDKVKGPGHSSYSKSLMLLSIVSVAVVQASGVPVHEGCHKQGESKNHGMCSCCSADLRLNSSTTTSSIITTAAAANIVDHPVAASFTCLGLVDGDCYFVDCSKIILFLFAIAVRALVTHFLKLCINTHTMQQSELAQKQRKKESRKSAQRHLVKNARPLIWFNLLRYLGYN